jgi:sugar lactone lactonase YvrE
MSTPRSDSMAAHCVLDAGALLGEGPVWDVSGERLYWVDITRQEIHHFDPVSGQDACFQLPQAPGSLAVRQGGGLIVAAGSSFHSFDPESGRLTQIAEVEPNQPQNRFNDGKTDPKGRFWAGTMHREVVRPTGALYRLDPSLHWQRMQDGIVCSNGLAWSPDGRTLYHADTALRRVWAWDFDPEQGAMENRRLFAALTEDQGWPDGATVDAEGFYWLAHWDGWRLTRFDPTGRVERVVKLPVQRPTCPAFGGPGLDVLYVTSARDGLTPEMLSRQPKAGGVFAIEIGIKGLPQPCFAG